MEGLQLQLMKTLHFRFGHRFKSVNAYQAPVIMAVLIWTLQIAAATEQPPQSAKNLKTKSIRITSDKLIANIDAAEILFIGNVKALQADVVITADRLKVRYDPATIRNKDGTLKTEAIRKLIARGNAKIVYENIVAEADKAEYTVKSAILVLFGKPARVTRDDDVITGSKFILQRADGSIRVESSVEERVRAILNPD